MVGKYNKGAERVNLNLNKIHVIVSESFYFREKLIDTIKNRISEE